MTQPQASDPARDLADLEQIVGRLRHRLVAPSPPIRIDARQWFALRRRRDSVFAGINLFSEPAWDILLALRIADLTGRRETIGSVGLAAGCPTTTAARYVGELVKWGLVAREEDPTDARRCFIALSERGNAMLDAALDVVRPAETMPFAL